MSEPVRTKANNEKRRGFDLTWILIIVAAAGLAILEIFPPEYSADPVMNGMISVIVTRAVGAALFIPLLIRSGFCVLGIGKMPAGPALAAFIPALIVCINNAPIIPLVNGSASVTAPAYYIVIYAIESLLIGLFEELAFRGVLYLSLLENRRNSTKQIFWTTVASSALFGCVHLFNLFVGGSPGAVLLQIGYSFLIGGMCSIVLLRTGCIWLCVLLHGIYDFGGYLVSTLGQGGIWYPLTVTVTAVIGVAAAVILVLDLLHIRPEDVAPLFPPVSEKDTDVGNEN